MKLPIEYRKLKLITIRTFDNSFEAYLLKATFENNGVECYIFDENMVTLNPIGNITYGGIKLKIREEDKVVADEIILAIEKSPLTDEQDEILKCPKCGATELFTNYKSMKGVGGVFSMFISFLLFIFPIYYKTVNKCKMCGAEFPAE